MSIETLGSTSEVMDALGGVQAVMDLTGATYPAASNWKYFNSFPSRHYKVMTDALSRIGKCAPARLWRMTESTQERETTATQGQWPS